MEEDGIVIVNGTHDDHTKEVPGKPVSDEELRKELLRSAGVEVIQRAKLDDWHEDADWR